MKKNILHFMLLLGGMMALPFWAQAEVRSICANIFIETQGVASVTFTENEELFICGDPKRNAWRHVPLNQVQFHTRTFLQSRGRFRPRFEIVEGNLIIHPGPETRIAKIIPQGLPRKIRISRKRHIRGELLTPKNLNDLENWTRARLQARGYPCPEVKTTADPITGDVRLDVETGPWQRLLGIVEEPIRGLEPGVLRRYDAFKVGKPFNNDFLILTSRRVEEDGIMQSAYFTQECRESGALAFQHTFPGPPRLVRAGIGANTQEYLILRTSWRHSRRGRKGSLIDLTANASYLEQKFQAFSDWHVYKSPSRWFFKPLFSFERRAEPKFEFLQARASFNPALNGDGRNIGYRLFFGPELKFIHTIRGPLDTGLTRFLSLQFNLDLMTHYFEFYRNSPRRGFRISALGDFNYAGLLSDVSVQKMFVGGVALLNLFYYDPPLVVLGVRGGLGTSVVRTDADTLNRLPSNFRYYLGGSQNLRGFGYNELPREDEGALSSVFLGFEARFGILPHNIQPLVFADFGMLGDAALQLRKPAYWSPGFGVRWESPLGVFRATAAHGFVLGGTDAEKEEVSHIQFYLSYGEEF